MDTRNNHSCWEIMQCQDSSSCPVRHADQMCWEWMAKHDQFQCQYGLCKECIVYLYHNKNTILTGRQVEEVMHSRQLMQQGM